MLVRHVARPGPRVARTCVRGVSLLLAARIAVCAGKERDITDSLDPGGKGTLYEDEVLFKTFQTSPRSPHLDARAKSYVPEQFWHSGSVPGAPWGSRSARNVGEIGCHVIGSTHMQGVYVPLCM